MGPGLFSWEGLAPRGQGGDMRWESGTPRFNLQLSLTRHGPRAGHCALPSLLLLICKMGMILPTSQGGGLSVGDKCALRLATSPPCLGCFDGRVVQSWCVALSIPQYQSSPFADDPVVHVLLQQPSGQVEAGTLRHTSGVCSPSSSPWPQLLQPGPLLQFPWAAKMIFQK